MLYRRLIWEWLIIAAISCAVGGWAVSGKVTQSFDNWLVERIASATATPPDERILLIEIDNESLRTLGKWPWPRATHARMMERLAAARPRAIAYDVLFLEPGDGDARLAQAIGRAGSVYLPALADPGVSGLQGAPVARPVASLAAAARRVGIAEVLLDEDGVVRRAERSVDLAGTRVPQLTSLLAADIAHGAGGSSAQKEFLFPYHPAGSFRHIGFSAVLAGEVPPAFLRDRIVMVGATAEGLGDIYAVPAPAGGLMPGIEIQANTLNAILHGDAIRLGGPAYGISLTLGAVLVLMLAFLRTGPTMHLGMTLGMMMLIAAACIALVPLARFWLPPGPALLALPLAYGLWAWRRLAAISRFLTNEVAELRRDPAIAALPNAPRLASDPLTYEADMLGDVIEQLRKVRGLIAEVIEELPDATCVVDAAGVISLGNAAANRLYGDRVEGLPHSVFIASISGVGAPYGPVLRRDDGTMLLTSETGFSHGGKIVRLADVTELQRDADEREEMLQFLSHDLRAPNAAILTLLEHGGANAALAHATKAGNAPLIDRIRTQASLGLRLADDFAQLVRARRRAVTLEPVDLADIAREAADTLWGKATQKGIRLVETSGVQSDDECWAMGDRSMLLRAAINLMDNAVKFAPDGTSIHYAVAAEAAFVRLTVSGPGPDLPPARRADPFKLYAAGRDGSGSGSLGLGLAFVQTCAKRHGGVASYARIAGVGAAFSLSIPAAPAEPE